MSIMNVGLFSFDFSYSVFVNVSCCFRGLLLIYFFVLIESLFRSESSKALLDLDAETYLLDLAL